MLEVLLGPLVAVAAGKIDIHSEQIVSEGKQSLQDVWRGGGSAPDTDAKKTWPGRGAHTRAQYKMGERGAFTAHFEALNKISLPAAGCCYECLIIYGRRLEGFAGRGRNWHN